MDCQKLHQEIVELESRYRNVGSRYEKAERSGEGEGLKKALLDFDKAADELLEKYLSDFQEQFGDKLGIGKPLFEGRVEGIGHKIVTTPWGDEFVIHNYTFWGPRPGLYTAVANEDYYGLSSRELIAAGKYNLGVFPMSDERLLLPADDGGINVLEKKNGKYVSREIVDTKWAGKIEHVVAMSDYRWAILAGNMVHVLSEGVDAGLSFEKGISLDEINPNWSNHPRLFPLSNNELLISHNVGGGLIFAKDGPMGDFHRVFDVYDPSRYAGPYIDLANRIADDKWLIHAAYDGWRFLSRAGQTYKLSDRLHEMINMDIRWASYLSRNELLIEDAKGDIVIYTMQPNDGLKVKEKINFWGLSSIITLSNNVWLMTSSSSSRESYVLQRVDDRYELSGPIDDSLSINGAIRLSSGEYLYSYADPRLGYSGYESKKNEICSGGFDSFGVLRFDYRFKNVEDLKSKLGLIIEAGNKH